MAGILAKLAHSLAKGSSTIKKTLMLFIIDNVALTQKTQKRDFGSNRLISLHKVAN